MNCLLIFAVKSRLKNVPNLLAKRFVFRGTKIVLARRTGSLSVYNEDYVFTQALFQRKLSIHPFFIAQSIIPKKRKMKLIKVTL